MAALRIDRPGSTPEVLSTSVRFPSSLDRGSGTFATVLRAGSLANGRRIKADLVDSPSFRMLTTISSGPEVEVTLVGTDSSDRERFAIPPAVDPALPHTLQIEFARWKIGRAALDQKALIRA